MNEQPDSRAPQGAHPPIVGVIGRSGSGKTTLIEALIPALAELGVRVATVKRTPRFDIDKPGKDSWRHGQAGATAYVVASASQLAFVETTPLEPARSDADDTAPPEPPRDDAEGAAPPKPARDEAERPAPRGPSLADIAARFFASDIDLVLHEGHRREAPQVVEVFRLAAGHDRPLCEPDESLALVTDAPLEHEHRFALGDAAGLARFPVADLGLSRAG